MAALSKMTKSMKKPAAAQGVRKDTLKKPAAAGPINTSLALLKKGAGGTMEEQEGDGDEGDTDSVAEAGESKRDKGKAIKYAKMRSELPEFVIDLVEKQSAKSSSPRAFKTDIINRLFKRDAGGKLSLRLQDPVFAEHKRVYTDKFAKEQDVAYPESILKGLYFAGDDKKFQASGFGVRVI